MSRTSALVVPTWSPFANAAGKPFPSIWQKPDADNRVKGLAKPTTRSSTRLGLPQVGSVVAGAGVRRRRAPGGGGRDPRIARAMQPASVPLTRRPSPHQPAQVAEFL